MPDSQEFIWDHDEWELHVHGLLQDRHGPLDVMKVPARHRGDCGIDYYSLQHSVAYQCYAVLEPLDVAERAEKQKSKITTDLKKFCHKQAELEAIFGNTKIQRWVLVVPLHDSRLVNVHVTAKTAEVKARKLPYVSTNFEVMIQDLESFDQTSREFRARQRRVISIPSHPASTQEIEEWAATEESLVSNLTTKLRKRIASTDPKELDNSVNTAIGWFLERENALESLRDRAPQLHETLLGVINRRTRLLTLIGPPPEGHPHQILRQEIEALTNELRREISNFSSDSAEKMALGTIADWLLRCPLDFPPYADVK